MKTAKTFGTIFYIFRSDTKTRNEYLCVRATFYKIHAGCDS